jgi:D-alanyl-D-alanine carboxypeptidase
MRRRMILSVAIMAVSVFATSIAVARVHHSRVVADGNGNVVSHKTGASARVGAEFAAKFQGYVDAIEAAGGTVYFMGGIRRGHCGLASLHPCGRALDICQVSRGRVDPRCHLPSRHELARIAEAHGLFEGGRWCHSDYGHAQVGETAAACGSRPVTLTASARSRRTDRVAAAVADPLFFDRLTQVH